MDFGFLNGINCLFTLILVFGVVISIYVAKWGVKWSVLGFILVSMVIWFGLGQAYENVLFADSLAYRYKIAIEQGQSNGFSERYYASESNQESINKLMASLNINKGQIGYEYGYGASDVENHALSLYLTSVKSEEYAPVIIPGVILFLLYFGYFVIRQYLEKIDYKWKTKNEQISLLDERIQELENMKKQYQEIIDEFDPEALKNKNRELISKIDELRVQFHSLQESKEKLLKEVNDLKQKKSELSEKLVTKAKDSDERQRLMRI